MASKLESEILIPNDLLSVVGLDLRSNEIVVTVASWEDQDRKARLHFAASKFRSIEVTYLDEDFTEEPNQLEFPWDYYGFDSTPLENERWEFVLNSQVLEIVFEAEWPSFKKL